MHVCFLACPQNAELQALLSQQKLDLRTRLEIKVPALVIAYLPGTAFCNQLSVLESLNAILDRAFITHFSK